MADAAPAPSGAAPRGGRGFGRGRGGRGGGRGGADSKEWIPCTKLGRLVKDKKVSSLEEIYLFSMPIKEHQIVDAFLGEGTLKDEVMKIFPVQKVTSAGQRTRFKAFTVVGDEAGHIGIADAGRLSVLTVLGWPMATQYAALPVASSITMVFVAWDLVEILRGRPREERYGGERP